MTVEHLQPLLDHTKDARMFFQVAERLARAQVPPSVRDTVRLGRVTALQKPDGGVRGIVAGDVVRRLVARTMSQQMMEAVQGATAPFQYALATRAGCECVAHALQGITELNPRATVTSIDGISAFDLISRRAMMQGLHDVDHTAVPFVSMFYGTPSRYLWEDDAGTTHTIVQGEGGEQGDAMMPLLFALGQHPALEAVQRHLADGEFIFVDDIYFVTDAGEDRHCVQPSPECLEEHGRDPHPSGEDQSVEQRRRTTSCVRSSGSHGESSRSVSENVGVAWVRRARLTAGHEGAWDSFRPPCIRASALGENVRGAPDVAGQDSDGL